MRGWLTTLTLLGTLWARPVAAECISNIVHVYPEAGTILPANGHILVVAGMGADESLRRAPRGAYALWDLISEDLVPLRTDKPLVSRESYAARVLRPVRQLKAGQNYALVRTDAAQAANVLDLGSHNWNVGPADTSAPLWEQKPQQERYEYQQYGCGPSSQHHITVSAQGAGYYHAVVQGAGMTQTFLVAPPSSGRTLPIGHGMCGGAFSILRNKTYRLRIAPVDFAGNRGPTGTLKLSPH